MAIYVTTKHLAAHWKVDVKTVEEAARRGDIDGSYKSLGRFVFDLEKAIASYTPALTRLQSNPLTKQRITQFVEQGNAKAIAHRPHKRVEAQYLRRLSSLVTPEEWEYVCKRALDDAKEGDWRARQWLSNYLIGKPVERLEAKVDMTTGGLDEGERASRVVALLETVKDRVEAQDQMIKDAAIDIESSPVVEQVDNRGESPVGHSVVEADTVDSAS